MRLKTPKLGFVLLALLGALVPVVGAGADGGAGKRAISDDVIDSPLELHAQHGGVGGHLPASSDNVELVGKVELSGVVPGRIADVGTLGDYAYLAAFGEPCGSGGVYVVDIADPTNPTEVGFIPTAAGSYVGEGVQALSIKTKAFEGDILVINNEICDDTGSQVGGFSVFDVTDPLNPVPLVEGAGDTDPGGGVSDANQIHSAFAWQQDERAYVVIVDDEEAEDVDIFDITDPANPVMVAEVGLADWPGAQDAQAGGIGVFAASFFHDVVVRKVKGDWLMLLSYWDAGYVVLNVDDPASPVFVNDTTFSDPDPETGVSPPEGNAHQAEWSHNERFILAADEDFSPFRSFVEINSGPFAGQTFTGAQGSDTPPIGPDTPLAGPTYFVGRACTASPPPPAPSPDAIAVAERGTCTFTEKAMNAQAAGYAAVVVFNNETSAPPCEGTVNPAAEADIPFMFVARSVGFKILGISGYDPANCPGGPNPSLPAVGTKGSDIELFAVFDGWGYLHLFDARTLEEIDTYAIPEALDPAFAVGFGDLSVHEVATDPKRDLAYVSYYAGGFRVLKFGKRGIEEVGHFIDEGGNNFWGVEVTDQKLEGDPLVLASDRDYGLYIFRYTGKK